MRQDGERCGKVVKGGMVSSVILSIGVYSVVLGPLEIKYIQISMELTIAVFKVEPLVSKYISGQFTNLNNKYNILNCGKKY